MIEINMDTKEFVRMFNIPESFDLKANDVLTLGENKYQVWKYEVFYERPPCAGINNYLIKLHNYNRIKIMLLEMEVKSKEKQEAEEAVKKAEESLKAAKAVLSIIKESN